MENGANSIHNPVRALSKPYAGAEFQFKSHLQSMENRDSIRNFDNIEPGKVFDTNDELLCPIVKCGDNALKLIKVEPRFLKKKEYIYENLVVAPHPDDETLGVMKQYCVVNLKGIRLLG